MSKKFHVTFTYTVEVEEDGINTKEDAIEYAMEQFINNGDYQYADIDVEEKN